VELVFTGCAAPHTTRSTARSASLPRGGADLKQRAIGLGCQTQRRCGEVKTGVRLALLVTGRQPTKIVESELWLCSPAL
jgi:hypothetical protein